MEKPSLTTEQVLRAQVRDFRKERDDLLTVANKQLQEIQKLKCSLQNETKRCESIALVSADGSVEEIALAAYIARKIREGAPQ